MDDLEAPSRKRARPMTSCLRCREKKLRCDRFKPCETCIKAGSPSKCVYGQFQQSLASASASEQSSSKLLHTGQKRSYSAAPSEASTNDLSHGLGILEDLRARIVKLEEVVPQDKRYQPRDITTNGQSLTSCAFPSAEQKGLLVVKGSRSRYHGQDDTAALLNQFAEAKDFLNRITDDKTIVEVVNEVRLLQVKSQPSCRNQICDLKGFSPTLYTLRKFLPTKALCDKLLDVYLANFEKTLRILHIPTFVRQYTTFWSSEDLDAGLPPTFLPQLTTILCIALPLVDQECEYGESSERDYLKQAALNIVEAWLDGVGRKQRSEISTLQVNTLVYLAKQLKSGRAEKLWINVGSLLRSAMIVGLHQDPLKSHQISFYQAENRRRLWITIMEMTVQASIVSSMPLMAPECDFAPLLPSNINDADYDESTTSPPAARPLSEWTDSLAQISLATSMAQRIRVINLAQISSSENGLQEVLTEGSRLEILLDSILHPSCLNPAFSSHVRPDILLNQVLVNVFMRRALLKLYRPFLFGEMSAHPSLDHIRHACLDSCLAILSYQDFFDPHVADLDSFALPSSFYWTLFQIFCKSDVQWAAISVCQYIRISTPGLSPSKDSSDTALATSISSSSGASLEVPAMYSYSNATVASLPLQHLSVAPAPSQASLTRLVEGTIDSLVRTLASPLPETDLSSSLKDILFLAVVLPLARAARGSPQVREKLMYEGLRNVLVDCRQALSEKMAERKEDGLETQHVSQEKGANDEADTKLLERAEGTVLHDPNTSLQAFSTTTGAAIPNGIRSDEFIPQENTVCHTQIRTENWAQSWPTIANGGEIQDLQTDVFGNHNNGELFNLGGPDLGNFFDNWT